MGNSPLVDYKKISPNKTSPRNHKIDTVSIHCYVGQASVEDMGAWFVQPAAQSSCNYGIGSDGRIALIVEEKDRSWCTSSKSNDNRAITIECASDKTHPYKVNDKVYASLIKLLADICKRNDIKELKWEGDKSLIGNIKKQNMTVHRWFANKACVPTFSEVLTRTGWVPLSEIEIGDEIACADLDNLNITFEEVYDMVPVRDQDTYTNNELTATMNHRMVYSHQQNKSWYRIDDFKHLLNYGGNVYIPLAGYSNFDGFSISDDMLRFLIAVQADGHYMYDIRKTDNTRSYYGVEFHVKKQRKIERLIEIIESIGFEYKRTNQSNGSVKIRIYNQAETNIVDDVCEKYLHNKCFTWDWLNISPEQAKILLEEILLWDGCVAANLYSSKDRINLDVVNAIAAINGVGSRIFGCNIQFRESPYMTLGENSKRHSKQHGGRYTKVSCVSVKTGIFLMRQDGKTFIVGNCPGDYLYKLHDQITKEVNDILNSDKEPAKEEPKKETVNIHRNIDDTTVKEIAKVVYGEAGIIRSYDALLAAAQCIHDMWKSKEFGRTVSQVMKSNFSAYGNDDYTEDACKAVEDVFVNGKRRFSDATILQFRSFTKYSDGNGNMDKLKCSGLLQKYEYIGKDARDNRWGHLYFGHKTVKDKETTESTIFKQFKVKVSINNLNIRTGAGTNYATTGEFTGEGVFTITEVKQGKGSESGWGKLLSGAGWISLDFAKKI